MGSAQAKSNGHFSFVIRVWWPQAHRNTCFKADVLLTGSLRSKTRELEKGRLPVRYLISARAPAAAR